MSLELRCLLGFVAWTLLLIFSLLTWRSVDALRGARKLDEFTPGVPHGTDTYWRLNRAHLNCVENLPLFGAVVAVAELADVSTGQLPAIYLGSRVAQSLVHLASGSPAAVLVRATFFAIQAGCLAAMVVTLARAA